ncbi:Putative monooxygenase YcnE [Elizabethkingia miricola]|nr:Putative monooxygenase YcnE [Elizabethkingia miricola]
MKVYITAILRSKKNSREELIVILKDLVEKSLVEKACIRYELQQGSEDQNLFVFHEIWINNKGLELHHSQKHFKDFISKSEPLLEGQIEVYKTNLI